MHCLFVGKEHDTQVTSLHLRHLHPPANAPVCLDNFPYWIADCPLNPFIPNDCTISSRSNSREIPSDFHL